jgi:hypothetical protein
MRGTTKPQRTLPGLASAAGLSTATSPGIAGGAPAGPSTPRRAR